MGTREMCLVMAIHMQLMFELFCFMDANPAHWGAHMDPRL